MQPLFQSLSMRDARIWPFLTETFSFDYLSLVVVIAAEHNILPGPGPLTLTFVIHF